MTPIPSSRGGWWHDYVCPTHGIELAPPDQDGYPCPRGCLLTGERYRAAWTVLEHQARARELRLCARRYQAHRDAADRDRAHELLSAYAGLYSEVAADGWSEQAEPWMLRGKLFAQALTEALWGVQVADAVRILAADATSRERLGRPELEMLRGLTTTVEAARNHLVYERSDPRSNYTAWLDCAGGMAARALYALGEPDDPQSWVKRTCEHLAIAAGDDGWEWEGSTYYHLFVLRAYLLNLAGETPAELPLEVTSRLARMVRVLTSLATPGGSLPVLHDGPYRRTGAFLELLEVCALARQLWVSPGTERIEAYARAQLGGAHDGLEDLLDGWFAGPPLDGIGIERGSVRFADVGVLVLRDREDTWQAVVDAGPHGGAHGHLDKLALYLYGTGEPWQPAPGVPPYASPLRRGHYARTIAHPTIRVDGADQRACTGDVVVWEPGPPARAVVRADGAVPGAALRRELVMADGYLLDVIGARIESGEQHTISLGLRPGGTLDVSALGVDQWRTRWEAGDRPLHGWHVATAPAVLEVVPGRGPSDDPAAAVAVADWTATAAGIAFVSVYWPGEPNWIRGVGVSVAGGSAGGTVRIELADGRTDEHTWEDA